MRPEDRARVAEWARQEAHKIMATDYSQGVREMLDDLAALAEEMSNGLENNEELSHAETQSTQRLKPNRNLGFSLWTLCLCVRSFLFV